jgi:hypothetical protein
MTEQEKEKAAAKALAASQAVAGNLPAGVPNPATQNAALMTPPTVQAQKAALNQKIEQKKAIIQELERDAAVMTSTINRGENKPGVNIGALNAKDAQIIAAKDELESLQNELAALEPPAAAQPDNSYSRHYQAMGDAQTAAANAAANAAPPRTAAPASGKVVKAADVIAKMQKDDATDGKPTIWDYLEAAGSGFLGRKSAYAEKKTREIENKNEIDRLIKATELQAAAQARAQQAEQANALAQIQKRFDLENSSKLAPVPGLGNLASGLFQSGAIKLPGSK